MTPDEKVAESSLESFPASDAPGWIHGSATTDGCKPVEAEGRDGVRGRPGASGNGSEEESGTS